MSDAPVNPEALAPALERLVRKAKEFGADASDAIATHGRSLSIVVRESELEDVDNSEARDIGLRVFVGQRQACVSSSDISNSSLDALAERAVAMARLAPEDPWCGLADEDRLEKGNRELDMFDPGIMTPDDLMARALEVEKAAASVDGVVQTEGCSASWATSAAFFMTSHGFRSGWRSSRHDIVGMALSANDTDMERDYDYQGMRWLEDLRNPEEVGRRAGERAVARLGSQKMSSGARPVIFDNRVASNFVSSLISAINGGSIARGTSFLKEKNGEQIFGDHINIIDDPALKRAHGSRPWDGEGVSVSRRHIIKNGRLTGWLLNSSAARQLGLETTGHAHRSIGTPPGIGASNTWLEPGGDSPEELMADIKDGLWIGEMFGPSLNPNTGDWSVGIAGFAIENGEKSHPVSEVTVAGNLLDIFQSITPANDLKMDSSIASPSLRVESLTIAGT